MSKTAAITTVAGLRALTDARVELELLSFDGKDTLGTVVGRVWAAGPTKIGLEARELRRQRAIFRTEKAADREAVWVLAADGTVRLAEINRDTLKGFALMSYTAGTHDNPREEIEALDEAPVADTLELAS